MLPYFLHSVLLHQIWKLAARLVEQKMSRQVWEEIFVLLLAWAAVPATPAHY
jgi:hypothetical protein